MKDWKTNMMAYKRSPLSLILRILVIAAACITMFILCAIIIYILVKGIPNLNLKMFAWHYTSDNVSMTPAIINTVLMVLLTLAFAAPIGIFSAIYLVEYAKRGNKIVLLIRMTTETLAGIPSIVYGLFGFLMFAVAFKWGYSFLGGALTLAMMVLPTITEIFQTDGREKNQMSKDKMVVENLDLYYGNFQALKNINLRLPENEISAFIGPSGCGKSTLLKCLNRMNDLVEGCKIDGKVTLDGQDIYQGMDVTLLRKRVGMVFQRPNPFPMSIYDNIAYGPRTHGIHSKAKLDDIVEKSLRDASIWEEVKDRLKKSALGMSGGQQQRLCIARALAVQPEVLLMDEPTSALDPISTSKIEDLAVELKKDYTIIMVTHNMQQAARISDKTAFFLLGEMVEFGNTEDIFAKPQDKRTEDYITGRFG